MGAWGGCGENLGIGVFSGNRQTPGAQNRGFRISKLRTSRLPRVNLQHLDGEAGHSISFDYLVLSMRHRPFLKPVLDTRWVRFPTNQLPPSFLAPQLAYLHSLPQPTQVGSSKPDIPSSPVRSPSTKVCKTPRSTPAALTTFPSRSPKPRQQSTTSSSDPRAQELPFAVSQTVLTAPSSPDPTHGPLNLHPPLRDLIPALSSQSPLYIRAHIHRVPFLLTAGDTLRLPFRLPDVYPGDVLRLNRATVLGSRDYTLKPGFDNVPPGPATSAVVALEDAAAGTASRSDKATRYIDERLFECRARVMAVDSTPMMVKEKTKRRQRHVRRVTSKHRFTVLRIMEIRVKSLEDLELAGNVVR